MASAQLGRNIGFAEALDDAQQDAAQERAGDRADAAENSGHVKALMPGMAPVVGCNVG